MPSRTKTGHAVLFGQGTGTVGGLLVMNILSNDILHTHTHTYIYEFLHKDEKYVQRLVL